MIRIGEDTKWTHRNTAGADAELCYTCGSCMGMCPVVMGQCDFSPMKMIRMAIFELMEELTLMPQIWYCLQCGGCVNSCPMGVKAMKLIRHARQEALMRHVVNYEWMDGYRKILKNFRRARLWLALEGLKGREMYVDAGKWQEFISRRPIPNQEGIRLTGNNRKPNQAAYGLPPTTSACFSCRECSAACPAFGEDGVFDPLRVFRLYNYGLFDELLSSPQIWLCYSCRQCTQSCCQQVDGCASIEGLQKKAVEQGYVAPDFPQKWRLAQRELIPFFVHEVDRWFEERGVSAKAEQIPAFFKGPLNNGSWPLSSS